MVVNIDNDTNKVVIIKIIIISTLEECDCLLTYWWDYVPHVVIRLRQKDLIMSQSSIPFNEN